MFSTLLVRDLALTSSAAPLIAHALHEELFKHKKTCLELGLVGNDLDGGFNRKRGARVLEGVWRDWSDTQSYGPRVEVLSLDEMDRLEADRERAIRLVQQSFLPLFESSQTNSAFFPVSRRAKRDRVTGTGRRRR